LSEINLAAVVSAKRREKGVTQEELALHVGVSKASVSKWEKGTSLPDMAHLPVIAAYFDITIDELMNYSPQLTDAEIAKVYASFAEKFANEPFKDVLAQCEVLVKKYYNCHKFSLQAVILYINHSFILRDEKSKNELLELAASHCNHILQNTRDVKLMQETAQMQCLCYIMMGKAQRVFEILQEEDLELSRYGDKWLLSQAHQALGDTDKAKEAEQMIVYESALTLFGSLTSYAKLNADNFDKAKVVCKRAEGIAEVFNIKKLDVNAYAQFLIIYALVCYNAGENEEALSQLEKYADTCINHFFPYKVQGDEFFDKIQPRLDRLTENAPLPRSETTIKQSMLNDVFLSPLFADLQGNADFDKLIQKMKKFLGGS